MKKAVHKETRKAGGESSSSSWFPGFLIVLLFICAVAAGCGGKAEAPEPPIPAKATAPDDTGASAASDLWPMFGHDRFHSGCSTVDFPSSNLEQAWTFRGTKHIWNYEKGASVWSSPVVGRIGEREMVFAGCYDRSVYALDAQTGERLWQFTLGWGGYSAPAVWMEHEPPMVFVAAADRTIYGIDATNGKKQWAFECMGWRDGVQCRMSAVTLAEVDRETRVFVGAWTSDPGGGGTQRGEVVALDAASGDIRWRRTLSTSGVRTPIVATVGGYEMLFVTTDDGNLYALSAVNGHKFWNYVSNEFIRSSPTFGIVGGVPALFFGTRFHSLVALNAKDGAERWMFRAGMWIDSTPALAEVNGRPMLIFGSYDRNVYGLWADDHTPAWRLETGGDVCSSPAVARIAGKPAMFIHSLDDTLYGIDAASGEVLWQGGTGKLMWTHIERGDSLWASPCVASVRGKPMLFFGSYDGNLYAFR